MRRSVQVVASDSRMIVFVLADGQSPAIRNDNLQFSVSGYFRDKYIEMDKIKRYGTILLILFASLTLNGQNKIYGFIYDEQNKPIGGVNIVEKGTTNGYITNKTGYFELKTIYENSQILVTRIGFQKFEFSSSGIDTIKIWLQEDGSGLTDGGCWIYQPRYFGFRYAYSNSVPTGFEFVYSTYPLKIFIQGNHDFKNNHLLDFKVDKTFLNSDHCPAFDLTYDFRSSLKDDITKQQYKLQRHYLLVEPGRINKKVKYGIGVGNFSLKSDTHSQNSLGGILSIKYRAYKLNSVFDCKAYYWGDYLQFDVGVDYSFRNFDFGIYYMNIKDIHDLIIKIGYRLYK